MVQVATDLQLENILDGRKNLARESRDIGRDKNEFQEILGHFS